MAEEAKIVTLFEFTQQGYEETQKSLDSLLESQQALNKELKAMVKAEADAQAALAKMNDEYTKLNKTLSSDASKKSRESFENLKKTITETQGQMVSARTAIEQMNKTQAQNSKQIKESRDLLNNYNTVLNELSKGTADAKVSMDSLTSAQKYLRQEVGKTDLGTDKYKQLTSELALVTKTINNVRKEQQQQAKESKVEEGSVEALRLKVAALKKEWVSLNQNSPDFSRVRDELQATTAELSAAEEQVGIYGRNVGNYKSALDNLGSSIAGLSPGLASATKGMSGLTASAMKFIATPIGAVIAAIVGVFKALQAAFTRSAEGQEKLNKIMGAFSGVLTVLGDLLAEVGEFLISIFEEPQVAYQKFKKYVLDPLLFSFKTVYNAAMGVGKAIQGIFSEEAREESKQYFQNIANDFNDLKQTALEVYDAISGKIKEIGEKAKAGMDIAEMENKLVRDRLKSTQELAENENKISELRAKAAQKDQITEEQRISYLKQAEALIKKSSDTRIGLMKQEYEIQKAKNALGKTNQEDLQKEADLLAAITLEEKRATDATRELYGQMAEIGNATKATYKTLLTERTNIQKEIAAAEAKVKLSAVNNSTAAEKKQAADELARLQDTLEKKEKLIKEYGNKNIQFNQVELDEIELAQITSQQNIAAIQEKSNADYVAAYEASREKIRATESKIIDAQKKGYTEVAEVYQQVLASQMEALKLYDEELLIYNEEQQEAKDIREAEYKQQQIDAFKAQLTSLENLQRQFDAEQDVRRRAELQNTINNQSQATATLTATLSEMGVDTNKLIEEVAAKFDALPTQLNKTIVSSLNLMGNMLKSSRSTLSKLAGGLATDLAKAFTIDKTLKDQGAKLTKFQEAVANATLSAASSAMDAMESVLTESIDRQREMVDEMANYQLERTQQVYNAEINELDTKLNKGEISEAKYRIEQIKAEKKKSEQQEAIEKRRAEKQYALDVKEFRVKKANDIAQAAINMALGITAAWSNPYTAPAMTAIIAAVGAAQIAMISAKKPPEKPKFAKGGLVDMKTVEGDRHSSGGVPVTIGNSQVAEVEGGEGALIISRKAMKDDRMKNALSGIAALNEGISGKNPDAATFEAGGYLSYEDFFQQAYNSLDVKRKKRKLWVNGKKYKLPNKGRGEAQEQIMNEVAEDIATEKFAAYQAEALAKLEAQEAKLTAGINAKIQGNSILQSMGITDIAAYNNLVDTSNARKDELESQIKAYKDLQEVRINDLKEQMNYDAKLQEFANRTAEVDKQLTADVLGFNTQILDDLKESGEITVEEYDSYLDQIKRGYGATTQDIIALKKKQVEATKKLLEEERNAELTAAQEVADYRTQALEQIRTEWQEGYSEVTESLLSDISLANEAITELSEDDRARYEGMVKMTERLREIDEETAKLNQKYSENEAELNDGVIRSREEQAELVAEQKRIQEEIAAKEAERAEQERALEIAKSEFEQARADAMESALKAFENNNFEDILLRVKELGAELQEAERNNMTLDKALAAELEESLNNINASYDQQIAAQDAILDGLEAQLEEYNLIHDKRLKDIEEEQDAFEANFNKQKALIDSAYNDATRGLSTEINSLQAKLANLQLAGIQVGLDGYNKSIQELTNQIDNLPQKYATGGLISMGDGWYNTTGASHANGGVPLMVGNSQVAEVEGGESIFAVNKRASADPRMLQALRAASEVNKEYSGVSLIPDFATPSEFELDYNKIAQMIGEQINQRPQPTYIKDSDIRFASTIQKMKKNAVKMW